MTKKQKGDKCDNLGVKTVIWMNMLKIIWLRTSCIRYSRICRLMDRLHSAQCCFLLFSYLVMSAIFLNSLHYLLICYIYILYLLQNIFSHFVTLSLHSVLEGLLNEKKFLRYVKPREKEFIFSQIWEVRIWKILPILWGELNL